MGRLGLIPNLIAICLVSLLGYQIPVAKAQFTAINLVQLRALSAGALSNSTITLSPTGGDPHPVTGVVTPGEYWINGDHIANPTQTTPIFLDLAGSGNSYDFTGTTIKLDTRKLDGFGRALGHGSGVKPVQISGTDNTVQGLSLIGEHLELGSDPHAQRHADWSTTYVNVAGDGHIVENTYVESRGSNTYGVSDAFGKGSATFPQGQPPGQVPGEPDGVVGLPYIRPNKANSFDVSGATNIVVDNLEIQGRGFGHGFTSSNTTGLTLSNSTLTGELFPSTNVINHEKYQEYGLTWEGVKAPDDIYISGQEDGVRLYSGVSNFTVENVVVNNYRQAFAMSAGVSNIVLNNVEAYGNEVGFTPGSNDTIANAKGDVEYGPLVWFQNDNVNNVTVDVELVGDVPVGEDFAVAYINGNNNNFTISSDLDLGDLPQDSMVRLGQTYFTNWRDPSDPTGPEDSNPNPLTNSTVTNNTNQMLVLGQGATNNTISSQAPIVPNGKDTAYDGISFIPDGLHVVLTHALGLGNNGSSSDDSLESNASIVADGGTLELADGIHINNEKLTITGDGVDALGALYTGGTGARFGSSSRSNESTIFLDGNASIGVAGDLIVGSIQGTGNLTKRGSGKLSLERSNSFVGDLIVAEGEVSVRSNGVRNGLVVDAGASITPLGSSGYNSADQAEINGTLDLNGRTDGNGMSQQLGSLSGAGSIKTSNAGGSAGATLELSGDSDTSDFAGQISTAVSLAKSGESTQILSGVNTYTGTTSITAGTLLVNGTHTGGGAYTVSGGRLGGTGSIDADITVESGGTLAPGASAGQLTVVQIVFETGSRFEIELGGLAYDQILADSATLAGDLVVSLLDLGGTFLPESADTFSLLVATSLAGSFDNVANGERIDTVGGEGSFLVTYDSMSDVVMLSEFALSTGPGDFDADGDVAGTDFLFWQRNGLSTAELLDWQSDYGQLSSSSAAALVPEPATLMLALAFSTFSIARRRR